MFVTGSTAAFVITTRPVTITADAKTKVYGNTDPALTYGISSGSLAFSDAFSGSLTRAAGESVANSPYAILQGTVALSSNYALTYVGANLSITTRPVTITAHTNTKIYNDTTDAAALPTITSGSLAFTDAVTLSETYDTKYVGTNKTLTPASLFTVGSASNYSITLVNDTTGVITPNVPNKLVFSIQPSNTGANAAINQFSGGIVVQVTDFWGNLETTDNLTKVTIAIGVNPGTGVLTCAPMTVTASAGAASFANCWIDEVNAGYKLSATDTTGTAGHPVLPGLSSFFDITPSALLSDVVQTDPDMNPMDGFDVLFGQPSGSTVKILNTNPGTFHYRLSLRNETGLLLHARNVAINGRNGGSATTILTVPGLPANLGTGISLPSGVLGGPEPAFIMQGSHAIHVHPNEDESVELDAIIQWAYLGETAGSLGDCTTVPTLTWHTGQPADGAVIRCIKVSDYAVPKHGKPKIDVNYEFRWKGTTGWASTAGSAFHAGFSFRDQTSITFDPASAFAFASLAGTTITGTEVVGLVGAGEKITGIGGFAYNASGQGIAGVTIKLFNSASTNSCTSGTPVAQDTTSADGFYFIWDATGASGDQSSPLNTLPSGVQYYIVTCGPVTPGVYWPARLMDHKLSNKEFDEEDWYVAPATKLQFTQMPTNTKVNVAMGTIKVSVLDAFSNVVTRDQSTTITLMIGVNPGGGVLSGTLTMPVVNGVATFTGLKINHTGNGYTLTATSNPFYSGASSNSFNISP